MLRIKTKKSKLITLILAAIVVVALLYAGYLLLIPKRSIETDKGLQTQAERKESEEHKKVLIEKQKNEDTQTAQQTTSTTDSKNIIITFYEIKEPLLRVASYVSDRVEDDGECKLIVTNKKTNTEAQQLGVLNSNTTSCGLIEVDISKYKDDKDAEFYIQYSKNGSTITSERKRLY